MASQHKIRSRTQYLTLIAGICVLIVIAACLSILIGAVEINPGEIGKIIVNRATGRELFARTWEDNVETIIWNIRFPRVLMACIVGAGLSVCGVLMQALTKNSLADPYVLGISSGASAGAVCAIILGVFRFAGGYSTIFGATAGAAVSITLSLKIASMKGRITSTRLVLAGIATSALFTALTNLMIYGFHTGSDKTKTAQYWMVGSLSGASWGKTGYVAIVFAVAIVIIMLFVRDLDVLLLGDDVAENLGVNTKRIKLVIILMATVLTGVVVSVSGVIGFIGLVVPHMVRTVVGSKHKRLIPAVILVGGLFTMMADVVSRVIVAPEELPIGIISALIGAPFFLYLIRSSKAR
ncbi:MAG: iron ABC transporter permease [Lachnospiraceae bacterium]|jgi:iron complex transport system permease protein|nr:iron ABC transporter permease [Lachnospiraceae bacterium]